MKVAEELKYYRSMKVEAEYLAAKLEDLIHDAKTDAGEVEMVRATLDDLLMHCANAERIIKTAPNSSIRMILIMRYQHGMSWREVAGKSGEDISADTVRKRAEHYLSRL